MAYQVKMMNHMEALTKLAGSLALLKAQSSQLMEYCAREAAQVFGGLSYTCGGQGAKVERLYREVRAYAIPGGSEGIFFFFFYHLIIDIQMLTFHTEIMLDFGMKMAVKTSKL